MNRIEFRIGFSWGPSYIWLHTTLEGPWPHNMNLETCWDGLWTLSFWALTISWSQLLARVWSGPKYQWYSVSLLQEEISGRSGASISEMDRRVRRHLIGSSMPHCGHTCGACVPCEIRIVVFECDFETGTHAEACPLGYSCTCNGRLFPVPWTRVGARILTQGRGREGRGLTAEYGNILCMFDFQIWARCRVLIIDCQIWTRGADIGVMFSDDVVNIQSFGDGLFDIDDHRIDHPSIANRCRW